MDAKLVCALSALRARQRRYRRVQRQIYVQPICAARWFVRHFKDPYPQYLSKLLPPGQAMAVHGHPPGQGCVMRTEPGSEIVLNDFAPTPANFQAEFIAGLKQRPKILPCKFFYDERGSTLFDDICELEEYYLTRTETKILQDNIAEISALCGSDCVLVELGSGRSSKTRLLLDHLETPVAYVPIDISRPHLLRAAEAINGDYFPLQILPVCADYNQPLRLPVPARTPKRQVIFFPGSTIGNFEPHQAAAFLRRLAGACQSGDGLLIGVDLQKSRDILYAAYNDAQGVTAAFNLNLLLRANRELGASFNLEQFRHRAIYDEAN